MSTALPPNLDKSFGAAFCGLLVTTVAYGITSFQTWVYLRTFPKDSIRSKTLVWSLWILDTVHVACASHSVYWYVITNYSNPQALDDCIWSFSISLGFNVLTAFIVQCWFTKRVWTLGRSKIFTAIVIIFVLGHLAFGMTTMVELFIIKKFSRLPEIKLFPVTPFGVTAVGSDIVIAAALCYYLHNVRTGIPRTESLIDSLIMYAIQRCLLTSFFAIVETICFCALPNTLVFLAIDLFMGKLYANSLLATLNSRTSLRGRGNDEEISSSYATNREPRIASKTGRHTLPLSFAFKAGSSNTGEDPPSFSMDSTSHATSSSVKNGASKAPVVHVV